MDIVGPVAASRRHSNRLLQNCLGRRKVDLLGSRVGHSGTPETTPQIEQGTIWRQDSQNDSVGRVDTDRLELRVTAHFGWSALPKRCQTA